MTDATLTVYGADWCRDCLRTKKQLNDLEITFDYIDVEASADAAQTAQQISGRTNIPVVVYPDGAFQVEPANADVEAKLRELALL